MAITINTNVTSLTAQKNLNANQSSLAQSMERLSSGLRINRAKDDAAGLAISRQMDKQIRGLNQGMRNASDGISVIQQTEGTLSEIEANLQRMNELATQASNATYSAANRSSMQLEFSALRAEVDRTAAKADFNGYQLADGTNSTMNIQVGFADTANDRISIQLTNAKASALGISAATITSAAGAQAALTTLSSAIDTITSARAQLGADESRLETAVNSNVNTVENLTAAKSRITDVDFAEEVSNMAKANVLTQAGTSMLAQANTLPQMALSLLG